MSVYDGPPTPLSDASGSAARASAYDFDIVKYEGLQHYGAVINGYEIGKIDYVDLNNRVALIGIVLVSSYRGQGIATEFISRVLDLIREQGKTITIENSVVAAFVQRFPQYADMVDPARPGSAMQNVGNNGA